MKTSFLTALFAAAAIVGSQASADYDKVYTLSEMVSSSIGVHPDEGKLKVLVNVDAPRDLESITVPECAGLTLDFQGDYVLTCESFIDAPHDGITNIKTTAPDVEALWKERFSVEGGGSNTLCTAERVGTEYGTLQLFDAEEGSTVSLDGTKVVYRGAVNSLEILQQNEVGIVWNENSIQLVGKIDAVPTPPVPEPTTGTLGLLSLAALAARRRRK